MAISKITRVAVDTSDYDISVASVAPEENFENGKFVQKTNREGVPRWVITLLVKRPESLELEQMDIKPYSQTKPPFASGESVRFVNDRVYANPWATSREGSAKANGGLWFESDGIEAAS